MIIPVFIPHGGCPERCSFCNQAISGGEAVSVAKISAVIERNLSTAKPGEVVQVAFYGGTFTALNRDLQRRYLDVARSFFDRGVASLRIATRPDAIDPEWMRELRDDYRLRTVELGVQSFSPAVLAALGRTHVPGALEGATGVLKALGLEVGYHMMVGCPEEGDWQRVELPRLKVRLERLRPELLRIHPLLVLRDSPLKVIYERGEFAPLSLEVALERCADLLETAEALGIRVIRTGLQPNDEMTEGGVVAGPYHPAFGELTRARVYRRRLEAQALAAFGERVSYKGLVLDVAADAKARHAYQGHRNENLTWAAQRFPGLRVAF